MTTTLNVVAFSAHSGTRGNVYVEGHSSSLCRRIQFGTRVDARPGEEDWLCPDCIDVDGRMGRAVAIPVRQTETVSYLRPSTAPDRVEATPVEDVVTWLSTLGRGVEPADVTPQLATAATAWAKAYQGSFAFMVEMRYAAKRRPLTVGQAKGVLNCWRSDVTRQPAARPETSAYSCEDGFYCTTTGDCVYKVQHAVHGSGRQYAKRLVGEKFEYESGAFRQVILGLRDGTVERLTLERARSYGHLYGRCMCCGRTLTDESSIEAGIGPVCAGRL